MEETSRSRKGFEEAKREMTVQVGSVGEEEQELSPSHKLSLGTIYEGEVKYQAQPQKKRKSKKKSKGKKLSVKKRSGSSVSAVKNISMRNNSLLLSGYEHLHRQSLLGYDHRRSLSLSLCTPEIFGW
mmetsp:Transcript_22789/g.28722  ORF Transcript_22789/g.28722 Transcript_22789/m.28722 type:complete len:127 (+) Transcript_22789:1111-1491(+)